MFTVQTTERYLETDHKIKGQYRKDMINQRIAFATRKNKITQTIMPAQDKLEQDDKHQDHVLIC